MPNILERMKQTALVFDGAMGTMIYSRGVFINTCYDEVCLSSPQLIRDIHADYVRAGADVIETNSFGANRVKLRRYGLAERVGEINRQAARLAREVAGDAVLVAGSVGPCVAAGQACNGGHADEITAAYEEQIAALAEAGVDLIYLETFSDLDALRLAAAVARRTGLPVFGSMVVDERGESALGARAEDLVAALADEPNIDGIGLNCGTGPAPLYDVLARVLPLAGGKPVVAMPNAGLPREVDGRMMYMANPEYYTEYAKKYVELGARGVGGCCGTTPEHIRVMSRAVKTLSGVKRHIEVKVHAPAPEAQVRVTPTAEKSRLANKIARGEKVATIEILPPRSIDLSQMLQKARLCHFRGVDAINIPDGPRASARISPMIAAIAIKQQVGIEPLLHYCCRDRNLIGMQADLMGGFAAGLANFLIVTGDPPKLGDYPDATGVFDVDAIGLTRVATNLNHGHDVGGSVVNPPTAIFVGVGANPVAVDMERELNRFAQKVEAGAEFAITQPVFDPEGLLRFLEGVAERGRSIPIIAGVWPLTSFKNAEFMANEVPGVTVPKQVLERMARTHTKEEGRAEGIAIAREICDAIAPHVAGFQVSAPFGNVETALSVLGMMD